MQRAFLAVSLALTTAATLTATPAPARIAEVICDQRDELRERLQMQYGAQMMGQGVRDPDTVIEIWSTPSTGAWTLVQSYANGRACILAMGVNWEGLGGDAPT